MTLILKLAEGTRELGFEFNDQTTLKQLQEEVEAAFYIQKRYQELIFKKDNLHSKSRSQTLNDLGLKDGDEIHVQHSEFPAWEEMSVLFRRARKEDKSAKHKIRPLVKDVLDLENKLNKIGFFDSFRSLHVEFQKFMENFACYLDCEEEFMQRAARDYFQLKFGKDNLDESVEINFHRKNDGQKVGIICDVKKNKIPVGTFYVKIHMRVDSKVPANSKKPDFRELLVYKLLQLMGTGPEVHFIPNVYTSRFALYIATRGVSGFVEARKRTLGTKQEKQLLLLKYLLALTDISGNDANYGVDGDGSLSIVDFTVNDSLPIKSEVSKRITNSEEGKRVCSEWISSWRLPETIHEADEEIGRFKAKFLSASRKKSYEKYLKTVQGRVNNLKAELECSNLERDSDP